MIDIHCHLLPEVDDGAKSWEIALEMCRMAAADGIVGKRGLSANILRNDILRK